MRKHRLLFSLMLMACVAVFYSCKEEEVEKPIVNTERVDALMDELRALQLQVLGATQTLDTSKASEASLKTQIAALKNQYNQKITYTLKAINTRGELLEGAVFSLAQAGNKVSKTADATGAVVFEDMRGGIVTGTVKKDGYTVANFTATLARENEGPTEDQNNAYSVTSSVPLLPAPGSNKDAEMFTIDGMVYANYNATDDTLASNEGGVNRDDTEITYVAVKDKKLKAILNLSSIPKTSSLGSDKNLLKLSYDNAVYEAAFDATTGKFTLKLPALSIYDQSFSLQLHFEEFVATQKNFVPGYTKTFEKPMTYRVNFEESENYDYSWSVNNEAGWVSISANPGETFTTRFFYSASNY